MMKSRNVFLWTALLAVVMMVAGFQRPAMADAKKWTVMVFINADNNLEAAGIDDINEMEKVGSTSDVNVVAQLDRVSGHDSSHGNWTGTRRFYVEKDSKPYKMTSPMVQNCGEVDMGTVSSLVDFAQWGITNYPAERYVLVVWNHGAGWRENVEQPLFKGISYDDTDGSHLTVQDLEEALGIISSSLGGQKVDILGMDACLMQMVEVSYQFRNYVDVCVASEETEPFDGWPYEDFLGPLAADPDMDAHELGQVIAETYVESYSGGSQGNKASTQSAIDCSKLDALVAAIDGFAGSLIDNLRQVNKIEACINSTQKFYYSEYKDLGHFAKLIAQKFPGSDLSAAVQTLQAAYNDAIIANCTGGSSYKNTTGLSIYIPRKNQYRPEYAELAFCGATRWEDFLTAMFYPPFPVLKIKSIQVVDTDGDGKVAPGESISITVKVANNGGVTANNAAIELTCGDSNLAITTASVPTGTIAGPGTVEVTGLAAEVSSTCPVNRRIELTVTAKDAGEEADSSMKAVVVRKPFEVTTSTLLIVKDITKPEAGYFTRTLDDLAMNYDVWDVEEEGTIKGAILSQYLGGLVIRSCPDNNAGGRIYEDEQNAMIDFLESGGKLFISGQDIGYGTKNTVFYKEYLSAKYVQDSTGIHSITGAQDSNFNGLSFAIAGGDGADNQRWPDEIDPVGNAVPIFSYVAGTRTISYPATAEKPDAAEARGISSSGTAGIFLNQAGYKVVYLAFGLEAVADEISRQDILGTAALMLCGCLRDQMDALRGLDMESSDVDAVSRIAQSIASEVISDLDQGSLDKLDSFIEYVEMLPEHDARAFRSALCFVNERVVGQVMTGEVMSLELSERAVRLNKLGR